MEIFQFKHEDFTLYVYAKNFKEVFEKAKKYNNSFLSEYSIIPNINEYSFKVFNFNNADKKNKEEILNKNNTTI